MRARLLSVVPLVLAAACAGGSPFAAAARVVEARDVDELAADAHGAVFISAGDAASSRDSEIRTADAAGANAIVAAGLTRPRQLALTDRDIYFLTDEGIHKVARGGGRVDRVLALDHPTALAIDGDEMIVGLADLIVAVPADGAARTLTTGAGVVGDLAIDGQHVIWIDRKAARVVRAGRDGSNVTVLADGQLDPVALAVADGAVAWITKGNTSLEIEATVATVPVAGGPVRVLHRRGYEYEGIALDGGWVYWSWGDVFSSVHRVRLRGGKPQMVISDHTDLDGIALDAGGLWIGGPDGLYRARRR